MRFYGFIVTLCLLFLSGLVQAGTCEKWVAKAVSIQGTVEVRIADAVAGSKWQAIKRGDTFCKNDIVRVKANSRAAIILKNDTILRLDQNSTISFTNLSADQASSMNLSEGIAHFISRVKQAFEIVTPFVNAAVEGTEFVVEVRNNQSIITVMEGQVLASNKQGQVRLNEAQAAIAEKGQSPVLKSMIKPQDAVQWALYYPTIIDAHQSGAAINRAAQLLSKGRVKEAQALLQPISKNTEHKDHASALALRSIIAVVNNEKTRAMQYAQKAVSIDSQNVIALLALSYAQQANFEVEKALATLQQAVAIAPTNSLALARLAEVYLMNGDADQANTTAKLALDSNPKSAKAYSVLGFTQLARFDTDQARNSFTKAMMFDQTDPIARLGLGLSLIRKGELEQGRREIEYAASLDPNYALIRSYLGKAYFEENRNKQATTQFDMAKKLDPLDPTPWFYSAIQKQTENRPVEALQDLQTSIGLNDNRAVYRSRLLLEQDEAARSASQARIYQDLGFNHLAQQEAYNSLNQDFSNYSAHRFLAEAYANRPRHEIGRVSEILQSQLYAPLNINPVAPHMSETNSGIHPNAGPSGSSFNEYSPLFVRNQSRGQISLIAGDKQTAGDEVVYSSLFDNASMSVGQYHYQTEGFRANNDYQHDILNFFAQSSISQNHTWQLEFKTSEKENGDLRLKFDPNDFSEVRRETRDEDSYRLGYHWKIAPHSDLIASFIHQDTIFTRDDSVQVSPTGPFGPIIAEDKFAQDISTRTAEIQYSLNTNRFNFIAGIGDVYDTNDDVTTVQLTSGGVVLAGGPSTASGKRTYSNAYIYTQSKFTNNFELTLGVSNDDFSHPTFFTHQINPKIGMKWNLSSHTKLRAAGYRTFTRNLVSSQTIEPTQISGFNQYFNDPAYTDSKNYGLALEHKLSTHFHARVGLTKRNMDIPTSTGGAITYENQNEYHHQVYLYWTPLESISVSTEFMYEDFDREISNQTTLNEPNRIITRKFPIKLNYHASQSWIGRFTTTYYNQDVVQPLSETLRSYSDDNFWIADAQIGYRLPQRKGIISIEGKNLTDEEFKYHDVTFRTGLAQPSSIQHDRSYWLRLVLSIN